MGERKGERERVRKWRNRGGEKEGERTGKEVWGNGAKAQVKSAKQVVLVETNEE
jgi:hypothetical protein